MKKDLKDIRFITLPGDRKIGTTVLSAKIPLPVEFSEGQDPNDIDFNSIVAGLIKVVAWAPENNNYKYYKDILLELQPEVVKELNIAAISKSNKKEYEFAEELMLAVNHLSEAPESYVNLAVLYAQMTVDMHKAKDDVKADMYDDRILEVLTQCINRHPKYAAAYSEISAFHMRHGNVEDARDALAKYVSLETDLKKKATAQNTLDSINKMLSSKDQIMYAYDKMMMGCADEAVDVINKYLAANEACWEAYFIRGWAKRTLEDFKGAQIDLLESLRIDGKNAEVYNELSICARESGDVELAKSYLQIAVDLDGTDVIYLTNLAFLHLADEEFEEARELMERARVVDPEDPQLTYLMQEYEKHTGDKIGDIISEEVYTDEDFEELHRQEKEQNITHKEI